MKQRNAIQLLFFAFVMMFAFSSCVKEGPMGLTGATGNNGTNGTNGTDANKACLTCHASTVMDAMNSQYELSKHFYGNTSARNTKWCARCHTSDTYAQTSRESVHDEEVANMFPLCKM